jgi:dTDP-glucose pyrophosphorylase
MLNIVIPMAGAGSRFVKEGYTAPKPLIEIDGTPMIKLVISNLRPKREHRFIFICQKEHLQKYDLKKKLSDWSPGCLVISVDGLTQGAACTVLLAEKHINNADPLMIANSDQYIDCNIDHYLSKIEQSDLDALIMTMTANDPKWSFVEMKGENVINVVEKEVVSNEATVGVYNYRRGRDFVEAAKEMIAKEMKVNNEYYVAPAYNMMIEKGAKIGIFNIGSEFAGMYGLGIPSDLNKFLNNQIKNKALAGME